MSDPGEGDPGEGDPGQVGAGRAGGALRRLEHAVSRLEAAADAQARRMVEDGDPTSGIHIEAEALRSLQHLLSDRLDAAIARLKTGIGG